MQRTIRAAELMAILLTLKRLGQQATVSELTVSHSVGHPGLDALRCCNSRAGRTKRQLLANQTTHSQKR